MLLVTTNGSVLTIIGYVIAASMVKGIFWWDETDWRIASIPTLPLFGPNRGRGHWEMFGGYGPDGGAAGIATVSKK